MCSATFRISILMHSFIGFILTHTVLSVLCSFFCGLKRKDEKGSNNRGCSCWYARQHLKQTCLAGERPRVCEHLKGAETDAVSHKTCAKHFFLLAYFKKLLGIIRFSFFLNSETCFQLQLSSMLTIHRAVTFPVPEVSWTNKTSELTAIFQST